jgi:PiT family inorganic phosphate transporter
MVSSIALGMTGAWLISRSIIRACSGVSPGRAKRTFDRLQMVSAAFMAFNHGLNDGQKFIGVFTLTLLAGGVINEFHISEWVIIVCALTMGLGTAFGGWRIIETVGSKMTRIVSWQGFAAETSASMTILGASVFGIPLSTTHTITSSIVGASAGKRSYDVRWGVLRRIVAAWIITFPACAIIAYAAAKIANHFWA